MALKDEIKAKVKTILDEKFEVTEISYIPKLDDSKLTFANTGLKFTGTSLYIDLRGSTKLLNTHNKTTVAKLHMAFFHTILKIAKICDGHVRSFNGDSALIFFHGNLQSTISWAVNCAMQIKYMIANDTSGINELLKKYSMLDFGIGIDYGDVICTKVGISGDHNRDIFWVGNPVNKSTVLGDISKGPNHIAISNDIYVNLLEWAKFGKTTSIWGTEEKVNIWELGYFEYNGTSEFYYSTSWHCEVR